MSRPQLSETSHHEKVFPVSPEWARRSWVDESKYQAWYEKAVAEPAAFWSEHAGRIDWFKPFTKVKNTSFGPGEVYIRWFEDGVTNVAYNCIDRHLDARGDQAAIIWEGDDPSESKKITYRELYAEVCRMANVLRNHGVGRGSTVTIYLPMIPEAAYAMLACARLGAIHSVVVSGMGPVDEVAQEISAGLIALQKKVGRTARSFYEEASRTLSHPRRSGRAIQGWGHACWDCEGGPRALTDEE